MNPWSEPPLLAGLLNIGLVFWVYHQTPASLARRTFMNWSLWQGLWNLGLAVAYNLTDPHVAFLWYKAESSIALGLLGPLFLHFVMAITEFSEKPTSRWILMIGYLFAGILSLVGFTTPLLMKNEVAHYYWGYYPIAGHGEWLFSLSFLALVGYAFSLLFAARRETTGTRRNQMQYLIYGAMIGFGGGFTNLLPLYGIGMYPLGNVLNSFYSLIVAWTIVEFKLMDIQLVLCRGTVYALLSGGLTVVYLSLVVVMQRLFGHYGVQENAAFYMAAFPVTVVLAPAMKNRIEPFVNRAFLGKGAASQASLLKTHNMALMGVLATEMAHELAKPLTHIMNEGSRLGSSAKGLSKEGLLKIEKEAQRAAEILDGFALLSPGRTLPQIAVPLEDLLEEALTALGIEEDRTLHIVRRYEKFQPVFVNPGQIVQVFTNVVQNAWQAMREGGTLTLSLDAPPSSHPPVMDIVIEDTGPGIRPDELEKVFEPFFTTKQAQGGRGVGLTISQAMVERHGGQIIIESPLSAQGGTRVRITLPMKKEAMTHAV